MILEQSSPVLASSRQADLEDARREVDRRRALEAARELFALRGFDGTTMSDVAQHADMSLKALYAVFSGKDTLFETTIADGYERYLLPLLTIDRGLQHPSERVIGLVTDLLAVMDANRSFMVLYARGSAGVPHKLHAEGRDPYAPYMRAFSDHLSGLIAQARPDVGAQTVHELAVGTTAALVALASDAINAEPARPAVDAATTLRILLGPLLGLSDSTNVNLTTAKE